MLRAIFSLLMTVFSLQASNNEQFAEAYAQYQLGERASSASERAAYFNHSLSLYSAVAESVHTADLMMNIGNCYFHLGEYAWAILHYERALHLDASNLRAQENLAIAERRVGVAPSPFQGGWVNFGKGQLYFALSCGAVLLFVFGSWQLWGPHRVAKWGLKGTALILVASLGLLGHREFFTPVKIVLVEPSFLYRDAAEHYATVSEHPLLAGERGTLEMVAPSGQWYRIQSQRGQVGYVPKQVVRIINQ